MILFGLLPLLAIAPVTLAEVEPAAPALQMRLNESVPT